MKFKLTHPEVFSEDVLLAPGMAAVVHEVAEDAMAAMVAIAPVDEDGPHPGRYKEAFRVEDDTYVGPLSRGGARVRSTVVNDSPEAGYVEWGTSTTPEHATMRKGALL